MGFFDNLKGLLKKEQEEINDLDLLNKIKEIDLNKENEINQTQNLSFEQNNTQMTQSNLMQDNNFSFNPTFNEQDKVISNLDVNRSFNDNFQTFQSSNFNPSNDLVTFMNKNNLLQEKSNLEHMSTYHSKNNDEFQYLKLKIEVLESKLEKIENKLEIIYSLLISKFK